jgi:hypothetical protein
MSSLAKAAENANCKTIRMLLEAGAKANTNIDISQYKAGNCRELDNGKRIIKWIKKVLSLK